MRFASPFSHPIRTVHWARTATGSIRRAFHPALKRKVFFLHVPKCGGTSITSALRGSSLPGESFLMGAHPSRRAAEVLGCDLHRYRNDLLVYFMSVPAMKLIGGHFRFDEGVFRAYGDLWLFTTVLRRPVDRWFSHYFFNKFHEADFYRKLGGQDRFKIREELPDFVESAEAADLGQMYVSYFSGRTEGPRAARVEAAKRNLEKFAVVGLLEEPENMVRRFEELLEIRFRPGRERVNPKEDYRADVPARIREKVAELCEPDREIYEHACRLAP